jgi:hypothetical protein
MRLTRTILGLSSAVVLCQLLAADVYGQTRRQKAPAIRISTALGQSVVSNYIEPEIRLGEDAYVFAIAVDVDRNIQVLHPYEPGISVRMTSDRQLHLPVLRRIHRGRPFRPSRRTRALVVRWVRLRLQLCLRFLGHAWNPHCSRFTETVQPFIDLRRGKVGCQRSETNR